MVNFVPRTLVFLVAALSSGALAQSPSEFEVGAGYLSAGVAKLVEQHGWELVWQADEDRLVEFPFTIDVPSGAEEDALKGAIDNLLQAFDGQFVADLYRGNRVVVIDVAPPNTLAARPRALPVVESTPEPAAGGEAGEDGPQ